MYDFVVVDAGNMINSCGIAALYAADTIYLVANPDIPSIRNAQRLVERIRQLGALGERIRVVYDAQCVTREETPETVASFVKQRTRWQQGFLQILRKGSWLGLPTFGQRLLAAYTFSYPFFQSIVLPLWPLAIASFLWLDLPTLVAMVSFLPLYALMLQLVAVVVGNFVFAREYQLPMPLWMPLSTAITYIPFHLLLGISAVRAVYRELRKQNNWEKTVHVGAHRRGPAPPVLGGE